MSGLRIGIRGTGTRQDETGMGGPGGRRYGVEGGNVQRDSYN